MKIKIALTAFLIVISADLYSQQYQYQYFEPIDTNIILDTVKYKIDSASKLTWQIGVAKKNIFNSSLSSPNVLVTDTQNYYASNLNASIIFDVTTTLFFGGNVRAFQWSQKLDLEDSSDFAVVEYSVDSGLTWSSYLGNFDQGPRINFYGFNYDNLYQLNTNDMGYFTGKDTTWRDVWLCFYSRDGFWQDKLMIRFTLLTDNIQSNNEGWMIDNFTVHNSYVHTVKNVLKEKNKIVLFPSISSKLINVESTYKEEESIIRQILISNSKGEIVKKFSSNKRRVSIDVSELSDGYYFVKALTSNKSANLTFIVQH